MAQNPAPLTPISYAVWYEHVSGVNAALSRELGCLLDEGKSLNDDMINALYDKHVADLNEKDMQRISASLQQTLENVSRSAKQAGEQANQYGSALDQWGKRLSSPDEVGKALADIGLQEILQNTDAMKESVGGLKERLDESQAKIDTLHAELLRAREEAMTDALTGLFNRKGFKRKLTEYLGPDLNQHENLSVLMLDIDHFKHVNDKYGHLVGDKVIRTVAQVIKNNIKGQDIGVRYGGEEFLVLLPETSTNGALHLAENLRRLIAASRIKRLNSEESLENVTISIGAASHRQGETMEALIGRADAALYLSKSNGRNRVTADGMAAENCRPAPAPQTQSQPAGISATAP